MHGAGLACTVSIVIAAAACVRQPVELGFGIESVAYSSPRLGAPITPADVAAIEAIARAEIAVAFADFNAEVSRNPAARYHVRVVQRLRDERLSHREMDVAGESRGMAGFGGSGAVSFGFIASAVMVYAPAGTARAEMIAAIGRGIGRAAVHEFVHQLLPRAPIHDSRDSGSYEFGSAARSEQYFGSMHWDVAKPLLQERLGAR